MRWLVLFALVAACAGQVRAQELYFLGGGMKDTDTHESSYSWQLEYSEGLGEHFATTLSYLNEGHVTNHHRDGTSLQLWTRTNLLDRRLSLAAGIGPYFYFDTAGIGSNGTYTNDHGWKGMASLAATWYTESRVLLHLRTNWVAIGSKFDTLSVVAGLGYQLEAPATPGPAPRDPPQRLQVTGHELTFYAGRTIVNSFNSEHSASLCVEYRKGLLPYLQGSVSWLYEGDTRLVRRNGLIAEAWAVRQFFDDRLILGAGGGIYTSLNHYDGQSNGSERNRLFSGIVSLMAGYEIVPRWHLRATWNRIVTNYDRDTDVIMGGVGYSL